MMGADVAARWAEARFANDAFPAIAAAALREHRPAEWLRPADIFEHVARSLNPAPQRDLEARFGQPPVTLYWDERFSIDVLFWLDGTTTIHQHGFSGAFTLLAGSSLHVRYAFDRQETVDDDLEVGSLRAGQVEFLRVHDTREIHAGSDFIHSVFHLDCPSVSLIARTHRDWRTGPQYSYLPPGVAFQPFHEPPSRQRLLQCIRTALRLGDETAKPLVMEALRRPVLADVLLTMLEVARYPVRPAFEGEMLATCRRLHGDVGRYLSRAALREALRSRVCALRGSRRDPEMRLFLALLANAGGRRNVMEFLRNNYPEHDPAGLVIGWMHRLGGMRAAELTAGDGPGKTGDGMDAATRWVVSRLLLGHDRAAIVADLARPDPGDGPRPTPAQVDLVSHMLPLSGFYALLLEGS